MRSLSPLLLAVVGSLALASCADDRSLTGPIGGPALRSIDDGSLGGNPEFFWLAPIRPEAPAVTGAFDGAALNELEVEICELGANGACGDIIERFTSTSTPTPQRLTVDPVAELYSVSWMSGRSHVDPDRNYRITVLRNGQRLGSADVDVVQNIPDLAGVDTSLFVGLKSGQQLPIRFRIDLPSARTRVRVNEVESSGGAPGDWIELYNTSSVPLSLAGYVVRDNDDTHVYTLPAGAMIPANGFYMVEEAALGFGLGAADAARFYAPGGTLLVDSHSWTAHAPSTYGRCPDGSGAFQTTTVVTKGAANDCSIIVVINEIESNGGTPGDWVELHNPGPAPANLSGFIFRDSDDTHTYTLPATAIVPAGGYYLLEEAAFGFGLGAADGARLFRPDGSVFAAFGWTAHAPTTLARCPNGVGEFKTSTSSTKGGANDCANPVAGVRINEIESSGGTPGDWVELYNPSATAADIGGLIFRDNDDTHNYIIPAGTAIAPGSYYLLEEAVFGFGLGAADAARLITATGTIIDSHTWSAHAATTYGRCPNGTGDFTTASTVTKGSANACAAQPTFLAWPGDAAVADASAPAFFGGNLSGLTYEANALGSPGTMWAVRNGPGTLYRLVPSGATWIADNSNGWAAGKALRYMDGTGDIDAEGVTFAGSPANGVYVGSERNNAANSVSRNSILRYDVSGGGATLIATNEWNITASIPATGANTGIEAVTFIPDAALTSRGFFDESKGHLYNPAEYAAHGGGLFFVGIELTGMIHAYALNHADNTFTRVASFSSGFTGVMALEYDADQGDFWAVCDDGCFGRSSVLRINAATGRFGIAFQFERPAGMPNVNNEGFALAPLAECVGGKRSTWWADDSETGGISIRRGTLNCAPF
jgi:hypothetical protein